MVTVYVVELANAADGVNVIWFDAVLTVAGTTLAPFFNWKVVPVAVEPLTASLKVAVTFVLTLTPVVPFAGDTDNTVGGVTSPPVPTVIVIPAPAFPILPLSSTPLLFILNVPLEVA